MNKKFIKRLLGLPNNLHVAFRENWQACQKVQNERPKQKPVKMVKVVKIPKAERHEASGD